MLSRVLLTTTVRWPSTARLVAAFAGVGVQVQALLPAGHIARRSRFLAARHLYDPLFPGASLRRAITAAAPDLVVPCDDRALAQLLAARDAALIGRSLGRTESYPTLMSRAGLIAAAREAGLEAPDTVSIASEHELDRALARIGYPAVLKVDGSWGGDGVAVLRNPDQAREAYRRFAGPPSRARSLARAVLRRDAHFLRQAVAPPSAQVSLQAFIPGTPATSAFACWQGRVLATIHMDVLETLHTRGPATVLRRTECAAMEQAAIRMAERFGLSGLHGLDFIRDAQGRPHLIEMNPRATQAGAFALGPGHDLAAALAGCLSPAIKGPRPLVTENPVIALFPQEWRRDPDSPWLHSAYPDVPWDDPDVLRGCLEPGQTVPDCRPAAGPAALTLHQAVGR